MATADDDAALDAVRLLAEVPWEDCDDYEGMGDAISTLMDITTRLIHRRADVMRETFGTPVTIEQDATRPRHLRAVPDA